MDGATRRWPAPYPMSLGMLGSLGRGGADPTFRRTDDGAAWRTVLTPEGPATQRLSLDGDVVVCTAWGTGAQWVCDRVPDLLGARDDPAGFDPSPDPLVARLWKRFGPVRFPATDRVMDALVPAILEQRVTGLEARRSWRTLVRRHGSPAPGPAPDAMVVPPSAQEWMAIPSWEWHRAGVERARSDTVVRAARVAHRLEECVALPADAAAARLRAVPGIGVWTAAQVGAQAYADADAVPYGDFHVPADVVYALTGETDGDDERLAQVLAPYEGHRGRVVRLVRLAGISRPARGPRYAPLDFRHR